MWLFTLWISAEKWLFLLQPNFGPLNCLDCINKHLETSLHILMPLPGPKKNQFWFIGTVFSPWNGHIQRWKLPENWNFLLFTQFLPFFEPNGPVNLWKWTSASKYLAGGTLSTILGHLEQISALKMAISCSENWLKNQNSWFFFQFLPFIFAQWTCKPVKMNQCIKILYWGYLKHHFGPFGADFSPENGHIPLWKLPEKS